MEVESLEKEKSLLRQEILQLAMLYTKFMESAAEKAMEKVVDNCKQAIQSICTEKLSEKHLEGSQTLPIVSNSDSSSKVNEDNSSETKSKMVQG
jgi:hypothetical protein